MAEGAVERIYITGGSGSGKSSLAREIASVTGLPVHDLDQVARVGGGNGPLREAGERYAMVAEILAAPRWVAEGIHIGWTDPLIAAADSIIWLDHVTPAKASGRIVRRFVGGAFAEARRQKGWRRYFRFRDYWRHLRELVAAVPRSRSYQAGSADDESRAATEASLAPYMSKVIHCRTESDVTAALATVTSAPIGSDMHHMTA